MICSAFKSIAFRYLARLQEVAPDARYDETLDRFLVQLEAHGRSPHTVGQYRRHVRLLARWAAEVGHSGRVADLSHEDLARFLAAPDVRASARGGPKKGSTTNCLRTSLQGFCGDLHRAGHIASDPSSVLRRAKCGRPPPRGLSGDDATRVLETPAAADGDDLRGVEVQRRNGDRAGDEYHLARRPNDAGDAG